MTLRNSNNAEICAASSCGLIGTRDSTHAVRWVNRAWQAIAAAAGALNLHTEGWWSIGKRTTSKDRVPANFDECVAGVIFVGPRDIRRPVANRLCAITPDTSIRCVDSRRIDVVA